MHAFTKKGELTRMSGCPEALFLDVALVCGGFKPLIDLYFNDKRYLDFNNFNVCNMGRKTKQTNKDFVIMNLYDHQK